MKNLVKGNSKCPLIRGQSMKVPKLHLLIPDLIG